MKRFLNLLLTLLIAGITFALVELLATSVPGTRGNHIAGLAGAIGRGQPTDAQANLMMYLLRSVDWFTVCAGGLLCGAAAGVFSVGGGGRWLAALPGFLVGSVVTLLLAIYGGNPIGPALTGGVISVVGFSWSRLLRPEVMRLAKSLGATGHPRV
jgi:hypothetical protein